MLSIVILLMVVLEILEGAPSIVGAAVFLSVAGFSFAVGRAIRDRAQSLPKNLSTSPPVLRLQLRRRRKPRSRLANQAH